MFWPKMRKFIQNQRFSDSLYVGFKSIVMLTRFSFEWKPHVEQIDTYI